MLIHKAYLSIADIANCEITDHKPQPSENTRHFSTIHYIRWIIWSISPLTNNKKQAKCLNCSILHILDIRNM